MLTRRIIPCLDIRGGRVVKGVQVKGLVDVGDPIERAAHYMKTGADELCFLDVNASVEKHALSTELVGAISRELAIPFTVGGGIRSVDDARAILRAGADKVAVNTAALTDPTLLVNLAGEFGRQCVVISIDTRRTDRGWVVTTHGGRRLIDRTCINWAGEATDRGAGEILLNVIDADGTRDGFALDITHEVARRAAVPVIASGGGGSSEHFTQLFEGTDVSGALAASIFHDNTWTPNKLKETLANNGIEVRL